MFNFLYIIELRNIKYKIIKNYKYTQYSAYLCVTGRNIINPGFFNGYQKPLMNSIQETSQEFNSMDSTDSNTQQTSSTTTEYAYRPLITKHRRAGSTGTTGDEEYTTDDDDELYNDDIDCSNPATTNFSILKSDLARAATDLFGYKNDDHSKVNNQPTGLFDDDDKKFRYIKNCCYFLVLF